MKEMVVEFQEHGSNRKLYQARDSNDFADALTRETGSRLIEAGQVCREEPLIRYQVWLPHVH